MSSTFLNSHNFISLIMIKCLRLRKRSIRKNLERRYHMTLAVDLFFPGLMLFLFPHFSYVSKIYFSFFY